MMLNPLSAIAITMMLASSPSSDEGLPAAELQRFEKLASCQSYEAIWPSGLPKTAQASPNMFKQHRKRTKYRCSNLE